VVAFQSSRGLRPDGVCGEQTWSSLVEAGYRPGDRFLYLRSPMLRGEDVIDLQRRLGALGFDAGRPDGIFGSRTAAALLDFQRNTGLTVDGICGPAVLDALARLGEARVDGRTSVSLLREEERLRTGPRQLHGLRVAVGETGGLGALADALGRALADEGAIPLVVHDPDESRQALEANQFEAHVFVSLVMSEAPEHRAAYYEAAGYVSVGGQRLAGLILDQLSSVDDAVAAGISGMRVPILRETRMPAVVCELGPPSLIVERAPALVAALTSALGDWARAPVDD
jgi:N-acetylmuramoyl-L-alanine amidase